MKVALVVTGGLHPSGREQVVPVWLWLVERLSRAHEVHAFVLRHLPAPQRYSLAGATIHDLGRPDGRWSQWKALGHALSTNGPFDLIHGYWVDPGGLLAAIAGRRLRIPSIVTCDSGEFTALPEMDYGLQRDWRGRSIVSIACRLATRLHVTTRYMESLARAHGHAAVRIPLGVDPKKVDAAVRPSEGKPWRVLQVASLNRIKDQSTLLAAVRLARQTLDVRLDLVGEDTLSGALQREAESLGVSGAVTFHGFVPNDELAPFHHAAHLYVQSSRHEAAGVSVLEAAAAGIPIVGTRVGYVCDWDPHAAVAVPPGDANALGAAIVRLLQNPRARQAVADSAWRFVVEHDADWSARALNALYTSLNGFGR